MSSCANVSMKSRLRRQLQARPARLGLGLLLMSALALPLAGPASASSSGVSPTPANYTPALAASSDGSVQQVRQLVQCGGTMYAVGRFTSIKQRSTTYTRDNAFSFSATAPFTVTTWNPDVNGQVNSIALSSDCSTAYLGGSFTSVNGVAVKNIAAVSTATGQVISTFAHSAGARVNALLMTPDHTHLLVGGTFKSINGKARGFFASLNPSTGKDDGYVNLNISGNYVYTDDGGRSSGRNSTEVYNFSLSPDGSKLLAMGVFTSVGGQARRQIFMLDLGPTTTSVDPWYSPEFDQNCFVTEPFYLQDASWSPDGSTIYTAATGYKPANGNGYYTNLPRTGLCDAAAAFPSTGTDVSHKWVNYTGCDSLYSTAADSTTVYIGGHERWANNPDGCDTYLAPGATRVTDPGLAGLDPANGNVYTNPNDSTVGMYTRGRGLGADDMLLTPTGLWIASDNAQNTSTCGGVGGHAGICFLPY
jgi:hypothetical protein